MILPMRIIGLTGGVGSGKSTVAGMFREEGIPVVDADRISREVSSPGRPAFAEIVRRFGREILLPDGRIDRKRLGAIVFSDAGKRAELEAITHPRIAEGIREAVSALAAEGHAVVLVEAALIHEKGRAGMFESVIGVRCKRRLQIERIMSRDGVRREEVERIVSSQMDPEEKARACDHVIDNSGDLAATRSQVKNLADFLRKSSAKDGPTKKAPA